MSILVKSIRNLPLRSFYIQKRYNSLDINIKKLLNLDPKDSEKNYENLFKGLNSQPQRNPKKPLIKKKPQKKPVKKIAKVLAIDKLNKYDPDTFKWTDSTDLENQYMTYIIKKIFKINSNLNVILYDEVKGIQNFTLREFIKTLKNDESFDILNIQEINNEKYPFLKIIDKPTCLKSFNEKLAEEKSKLYGRTIEKKRDLGVKYLKLSWEISEHDLQNQKLNEIKNLLKMGQKTILLIDTKNELSSKNLTFEIEKPRENYIEPKLNEFEAIRRNKILEFLKNLFTLLESEFDISGSINKRILMNVKPKKIEVVKSKEKSNDKKLERQLKQKQREEEKKLKLQEKKRLYEELLQKNNL